MLSWDHKYKEVTKTYRVQLPSIFGKKEKKCDSLENRRNRQYRQIDPQLENYVDKSNTILPYLYFCHGNEVISIFFSHILLCF